MHSIIWALHAFSWSSSEAYLGVLWLLWTFLFCYWQQSIDFKSRSKSTSPCLGSPQLLSVRYSSGPQWNPTCCGIWPIFSWFFPVGSLFKVFPFSSLAGHLAHPRGWDRPAGQFRVAYEPLHRAAAQRAGTAEGLHHPAQGLIYAAEDPWPGKVRCIHSVKLLSVFCSLCDYFI